ncbi:MAG: hypothetical protein IH811_07985 [Proteobacteria bacterium]|nr:hypothetical protein [Pseudomonadota bacterium]
MNTSPQIELTSKDRLLTSMRLAIDETKLIRSIRNFRDMARQLKADDPFSLELKQLNKEITDLEARLKQVRSMAKEK